MSIKTKIMKLFQIVHNIGSVRSYLDSQLYNDIELANARRRAEAAANKAKMQDHKHGT